jgi:hypothetical protein
VLIHSVHTESFPFANHAWAALPRRQAVIVGCQHVVSSGDAGAVNVAW